MLGALQINGIWYNKLRRERFGERPLLHAHRFKGGGLARIMLHV